MNYLSHLFLLLLFRCDLLCPMLETNHKQATKSSCENSFSWLRFTWLYCWLKTTTLKTNLQSRRCTSPRFLIKSLPYRIQNTISNCAVGTANFNGLPFGLVLQVPQEVVGPTFPHLDAGEGCTADRGRRWVSSAAVKATKKTKKRVEKTVKQKL